jgi:C-terminal processing protease CtpA/Prc
MKFNYLYLIIATSVLFSCVSKEKFNTQIKAKHSLIQLKEDLNVIKTALEEGHPGLYWYISKQKLDFKFDSINKVLTDATTSLQFYRMVAPIVSEVKCGHTRLVYPGLRLNKFQKDSVKKVGTAPLNQLYYFVDSNKIYVESVSNKDLVNPLKATEVLAIDSIPASEIIKKTKSLFGSDGYNQTFYNHVLTKSLAAYYYLQFGRKDSSILQLKKINKPDSAYNYVIKILKIGKPSGEVKKLTPEEIKKIDLEKRLAKKQKRKDKYKGFDTDGSPILSLKYDTVLNSTAIMKVKSFSADGANHKKFFKESFDQLKEKAIQNLILDLRDNGGGSLSACNKLFRYLYNQPHQYTGRADMVNRYFNTSKYISNKGLNGYKSPIRLLSIKKDSSGFYTKLSTSKILKPLENSFNNNLIVLINGYSFSATSLLSANLQSVNRGYFIGEETGGGYNQCTAGSIPFINLPNTGLKLRLPLKEIKITQPKTLIGRGVFPNLEVKPTIEDVVKGRDVVMNKAMEKIKFD